MTNHAQTPATGTDDLTPDPTNDNPAPLEYFDFEGRLGRMLHLTLEQHNAYVALEQLIDQHGFHEVLDDAGLICRTLHCTPEHWHDDIAPAIVPILESEQEEVA
jgi:hypothetical protein